MSIKLFLGMLLNMMTLNAKKQEPLVYKKILKNGLVVLVRPVQTSQKVSIQLWYNVGSKDEDASIERGSAHLLEHMIFKGTQRISETDIFGLTQKLSGDCNAGTSTDYTLYYFDFPEQHWQEALPVLADCMRNCTFKQDLLNAEFKTVIQELRMGKDNYVRQLILKLSSTIFEDHPYHYPTIGYKQALWSVTRDHLLDFYKKHYIPNNAALVVVGNVDPEQVFSNVEKYFGSIEADTQYHKNEYFFNNDFASKSVTLYRDVQKPEVMLAYVIPGINTADLYAIELLAKILAEGKNSRLYKLLVDETKLANWVSVFTLDKFEHDLLCIQFEPKNYEDTDKIISLVQAEFAALAQDGAQADELQSAAKKAQSELYSMLESNFDQAYSIAKYYLARNDENYIFNYMDPDLNAVNERIKTFVATYLRSEACHKGEILPISAEGKKLWQEESAKSDVEDQTFLAARQRQSQVEPLLYTPTVTVKKPIPMVVKPDEFTLSNNLNVITYQRTAIPKISLTLRFKADNQYNPDDKPGLYQILCYMMREGTKNYSATELAYELESRGITLSLYPGGISMSFLNSETEKALELLGEIVYNCVFTQEALDKVKDWARSNYQSFSDSPKSRLWQLIKEKIYPGHPYSKFPLSDFQTIENVTLADVNAFYKKVITPDKATMAIVGDFNSGSLSALLKRTFGAWPSQPLQELQYPTLSPVMSATYTDAMNRDQVALAFAGRSIKREDPDFDALAIFDQIFGKGLNSRLFAIRMQYGIFYTIYGTLVEGADIEPGMIAITTIVSPDKVALAEDLIKQCITTVIDSITDAEVETAKNMLLNISADAYSTNESIARTLLFLDKFNLPYDYFVNRAKHIEKITVEDIKTAARKYLKLDSLIIAKVGRV